MEHDPAEYRNAPKAYAATYESPLHWLSLSCFGHAVAIIGGRGLRPDRKPARAIARGPADQSIVELSSNPPRLFSRDMRGKHHPLLFGREAGERPMASGSRHVQHAFFVLGPILPDVARPTALCLRPGGRAEGWE